MFLLSYFSLILFSHFLSLHVSVCFLIFSNFSLFIYFSCLLLRVSAIYFSNFTTLYFFLPFMMLFSSISFAFFVTLLSIIIIIFFFVVCEFFHLGFLCNYPSLLVSWTPFCFHRSCEATRSCFHLSRHV